MSKYKSQKITIDGIRFDSKVEADYYVHLKNKRQAGEIQEFTCQPKFQLQPSFVDKQGKKQRPVFYIADFEITLTNGEKEVIDIKGLPTETAKLKRKLFTYVYPNLCLKWIVYVKKRGGWIDFDLNQKLKKNKN